MPTELFMVALAALLAFVQTLLPSAFRAMAFGPLWNAGPRDTKPAEDPLFAQRMDRALRNYLESFPIFVAAAIGVVTAGASSDTTALGAQVFVAARVLYVPAYLVHIPFVRSTVWAVAVVGLLMVLLPLIAAGVG